MSRTFLDRAAPVLALLGAIACASCGSGESGDEPTPPAGSPVRSVFVAPASFDEIAGARFFDHPWPSDARLDADGTPRWKGWPNPRELPILAQYVAAADALDRGFSPAAAGYVRFDGDIDPSTLPADPVAAAAAEASVQLLDVDPASPDRGRRRLLALLWRANEGVYWPARTLAFAPALGHPLRPATRYALVVTDRVRGADPRPGPVGPSDDLRRILGFVPGTAASEAVRAAWAPALAEVEAAGVPRARIAHLAVFTTSDPVADLLAVRDDVRAAVPAPAAAADKWALAEQTGTYDVYEGEYGPSPDYQQGNIPFEKPEDGGGFVVVSGKAQKQRDFSLRFALVVPDEGACPMPKSGYPIVLYAHGTTGDYRSFIRDKTAAALAARCLASMGIDQIFHGTRPGAPTGTPAEVAAREEVLFFNFQNPVAARTNPRQAAIDEVQRARLFTETRMTVPANVAGRPGVRFDPDRVMFFGHSQGGLNGPLFLAIDDSTRGGVLSGSGSMISITLLEKVKPEPSVAHLVRSVFLGLAPEEWEELSPLHPAMTLAQSIVDVTDPIHYVGMLFAAPRAGYAPKSIYQTEGVEADFTGDSYTPPHAIEVQAVASRLPLMEPAIHPIAEAAWAGPASVSIPAEGLSGNLAGGLASGVLAQWPASGATDGHFVVFQVPAARAQAAKFLRNLADDARGRVPPP